MSRKVVIEIDINPTKDLIEIYKYDVDSIVENEIESVLEKLRYRLDGFDFMKSGEYNTLGNTKVNIYITNK